MRRPALAVASILAAEVALTGLAFRSWYVAEDAFISLRYVRNWADGLGLRYNLDPSEAPVEGFSNFAWVALLTAARKLGFDEVTLAPALCLVAAWAVVALVAWLAGTMDGPWDAGRGVAAAWIVAVNGATANWASSGLETMQNALTLLVAWWIWVLRSAPWAVRAGVLVLLAASRPEGIVWCAAMVCLALLTRCQEWRRILIATAVAAVAIGGLLLLRHAWFGDWLANTVHAKSGGGLAYFRRGLSYVLVVGAQVVVPWVALPAVLFQATPASRSAAVLFLGGMVFAGAVGGDWMPFGRFLLVTIPFGAILLVRVRHGLVLSVACVALQLLPQFGVPLSTLAIREALSFRREAATERQAWESGSAGVRRLATTGRMLRQATEPHERLVLLAIGAIGYYSERDVIDLCSLVQRAPEKRTATAKAAGHDSCRARPPRGDLERLGAIAGFGFEHVSLAERLGATWTMALPQGGTRTYTAANTLDSEGLPGRFFYVDRY